MGCVCELLCSVERIQLCACMMWLQAYRAQNWYFRNSCSFVINQCGLQGCKQGEVCGREESA